MIDSWRPPETQGIKTKGMQARQRGNSPASQRKWLDFYIRFPGIHQTDEWIYHYYY